MMRIDDVVADLELVVLDDGGLELLVDQCVRLGNGGPPWSWADRSG
jgi:hypothetical protein